MAGNIAIVEQSAIRRLRVVIHGAVQGVGFRPFVYRLATSLDLRGWVRNDSEGVFLEVEGGEDELAEFLHRLDHEKPAISFIQSLESTSLDAVGFTRFEIRPSEDGKKTTIVLPDLATCPDCLREIFDPRNRRHRYPFTNCTNCGPRFSIVKSLPYDRRRTSMSGFMMCAACYREYHDPGNRRFHAQPNACPDCGPRLELWDHAGSAHYSGNDALLAAAHLIRRGQIVAVKGLGGFHLMCDARNDAAVAELRARKHREEKPLAVMFRDIAAIERYCYVSRAEEHLLQSPASPIVLLERHEESDDISALVAPGNPYLGVLLPYTPLHHLLTAESSFPVVATSGNVSEEPICTDEHDAVQRLRDIADSFLIHNRPIARHVDDSVVRIVAGRELVLRRARGYAPLPVQVQDDLPPAIAVGAHQKNAIAAAVGRQVFVSQHIGDLETTSSLHAFERVIKTFRQMYELTPQRLACDMHPAYLSTQFAQRQETDVVPVQHHYAHVLSCMAENELEPPVLGIAWDGSGYGLDGTVWGGEFLRVDESGMRRVGHFRTFRLPGNERAVREPRRAAIAVLHETFANDAWTLPLPPMDAFRKGELHILRSMLERGVNAPVTSSAGRLFDAIASIAGVRQVCRHEGHAAMELEFAIESGNDEGFYPFDIEERDGVFVFDWRPMVRAIVAEHGPTAQISAKFHHTLVEAGIEIARRIGEPKVALTGGCFQNRYLTERFITRLRDAGFTPYWHQRVPPNDGGIALGQIVAAGRELRAECAGGHDVPRSAR